MPKKHLVRSTKTRSHHRHGPNTQSIKKVQIETAIRERNIKGLRHLGRTAGGFLNNSLRKQAWSLLLRHDEISKEVRSTEKHKDEDQVALDVARSFNAYPKAISPPTREKLRIKLTKVITHVLRTHPRLHYYQGFHDICSVFTLVFNERDASILMEHVALFYIRDAMLDSLEPILRQLTMLDTLIQKEDPKLHDHITSAGVLPYYCLSWVITWFSHDLNDLQKILRLFDLFLSSAPLMPLYMSAAIVLAQRKRILAEESDMSLLHTLLTNASKEQQHHHVDVLEQLIETALRLETAYPPLTLQIESGIALDEVSAINMFDRLWLATSDMSLSRAEACRVLAMTVDKRTPLDLAAHADGRTLSHTQAQRVLERLRATYLRDPTLWSMVLLSAGVATLALLSSRSDTVWSWLTTVAYTYTPFH
ncbi:rab-GTPase-TBC domain-containing protein [Dichotomocladium elegans]|nr:rab-GTPase-TBC domain-containing protein [Dichotomocladium elegans]